MKTCRCGATFEPKSERHAWCQTPCRVRHWLQDHPEVRHRSRRKAPQRMRTCVCGSEFKPRTHNHLHCSMNCRVRYWYHGTRARGEYSEDFGPVALRILAHMAMEPERLWVARDLCAIGGFGRKTANSHFRKLLVFGLVDRVALGRYRIQPELLAP